MLAEADIDDDGEVDFDEFVQMVLQCDLHPTMCRRCQDSQFVTFEDAWFGESRLDRDKSTCRQRMVARDEKAIHLSLAMVAYGSVVQTLLLVLGALLWWGSSHDELAQTADALAVAIVSIVMASFAVTIGCAGRPVNRWAFVVFAVWQVVAGVMVVLLMLDITNGEGACELSLENGLAPTSTSLACPQLVQGLQAVAPARERCESSIANGRCQWADMCTSRSPERCEKTKRPGLCIYVSDGCRTTDNHSVANIGDVHGVCAPTGQCRFASAVWIAGVVFLCVAGLSLLAVVNVLNNSRYPLRISLATRYSRRFEARISSLRATPPWAGLCSLCRLHCAVYAADHCVCTSRLACVQCMVHRDAVGTGPTDHQRAREFQKDRRDLGAVTFFPWQHLLRIGVRSCCFALTGALLRSQAHQTKNSAASELQQRAEQLSRLPRLIVVRERTRMSPSVRALERQVRGQCAQLKLCSYLIIPGRRQYSCCAMCRLLTAILWLWCPATQHYAITSEKLPDGVRLVEHLSERGERHTTHTQRDGALGGGRERQREHRVMH